MNIDYIIIDIINHPLEYLTMLTAFVGAYLSSDAGSRLCGWGFLLWVFSNGYMLIGFLREENLAYSLLFFGYECMNLRGIYNNWFRNK